MRKVYLWAKDGVEGVPDAVFEWHEGAGEGRETGWRGVGV